ncbi:restriction endonuclease subunit S [Quatrionicoccus australiensis]|uniref:restriction endonuclease subunit S n=1 Tax=Quatrionicoccus australiensis TaxID=138118 RepID=UPI001CF82609|nr:restriction endonuclease subunit S [Quatrionicoccus australiensis]UCV15615.1 restriction endonuclease subunit S [Quatrionicoccus australiensis]
MTPLLLGDLFELKYGKSLRKDQRNEGAVPVFGSNGQVDSHNESLINFPTIIVGRKGSIGEVHFVKTPSWPIDTTYFVEPRGEHEFSLDWLYRLLRTLRLQELNRSAAIPGLNRDDVYRIPVLLPSFEDQIRIAHLLGKVEGLIAQRKQHLQQLDDLLKSVFLEMFGDPIVNPKGFPIRRLSDFYVNPKEGTKCGPFGSALKKEELVESGIPVWNMDNIGPAGQIALPFRMWITSDKYAELAAYNLQDGDIVISRAGTVGKMCVVRMQGQPAIISTNLIRLRLGAELRPLHFVSLMLYCKGRVGRLKTGADGAFTHMNTGVLDSLEFPYPPIKLQDQFAEVAHKVEEIKSSYQQSLDHLETLYGALSQRAFKGELNLSLVNIPGQKTQANNPKDNNQQSPDHEQHLKHENSRLLATLEGRIKLLRQMFDDAINELWRGGDFDVDMFWIDALSDSLEFVDENSEPFGVAECEHLKKWVFEMLDSGHLEQRYDEFLGLTLSKSAK